MIAFVLVSEAHTGGWIWRETADRLRAAGFGAHPVTLTGLGHRRHLAGPDTDLATHVEDVVQLIDHLPEEQVVLVGHGYGIHPAVGAADRRRERIARVVYLDVGLPRDGAPALALVPDHTLHDRLRQDPQAGPIPAPALDQWSRWGSTAGVPLPALERLTRLAAPQPVRTLTQPLRIGAPDRPIPATTGVLCSANGSTIAMLETRLGFGDPQLRALVDPRVTFFELDTGHWPMLSCPEELADTLRRAAAGEGHRLTLPAEPDRPAEFLLPVPERPRERIGRVDLYLPDGASTEPRPAVVFVHGGPVPESMRPTPRDWPAFVGYGSYAASLGVVGVTLDHRLHEPADFGRAAQDVAEAVELVRADPRVDPDRIALWAFSGGGLLTADWLAAPPPWLRCLAASYPVLAPPPSWGAVDSRFRPAQAVAKAGRLPLVLTRVGLEDPAFAASVGEFLAAAEQCGADVELVDLPGTRHGFETTDHTEEAREGVRRAMAAVLTRLTES
ncbi:alpha/beta fold hydrolase [Kitasatospora acidiphila]|uniref:Alpha/beta fold hydrolase n=1 Tax=Kitasatospora acidiphila TaxID=2567942 RepID=A0A540WDF3_9ACTN|nr:alpha/beta fold hydrolase [Kitasatospora acidiphila]TQF07070.1 alpha/beta fold hydrolase [Kitasatospora acidiphila]